VTAAASVSIFKPEFGDFLYAAISVDSNEMPLTVLSALSRLDVDPWEEAAELCELPKNTAAQRLASLIARLPGGRWAQDAKEIADRLLELLPHRSHSMMRLTEKAHGLQQITSSPMIVLICAALGLAALIVAANRESSSRGDHADVPGSTRAPPPQTSVTSLR
jgi:hypothetical protein